LSWMAQVLDYMTSNQRIPEDQPHASILNEFIETNRALCLADVKELTNLENVTKMRQIVEASFKFTANVEELKDAALYLQICLQKEKLGTHVEMNLAKESALEKLQINKTAKDWILRKSKDGIEIFTREIPDSVMFITKAVTKIKTSMRSIFDYVHRWTYELKYTGLMTEMIEKFDEIHSDWLMLSKLPFPFSNREWLISRWDTFDPKKSLCLGISTTRPDRPVSKKWVRANCYLNAHILELDADPEYVNLEWYCHVDINIKLPAILINHGWTETFKSVDVTKKDLEGKLKQPKKKKSQSSESPKI